MQILLTNDDGIHAPGLENLRLALEAVTTTDLQVTIVAPDRERSATGHGITLHKPLRLTEHDYSSTTTGWSINGTPADCVKLAIHELLPTLPDLVISGINRGGNLGTDVLYSGTVSAAIESTILGVPAMAVSLNSFSHQADYTYASQLTRDMVLAYPQLELPNNTLLNVNVPPLTASQIQGIRLTKLGIRRYQEVFEARKDPRGKTYYWLAGDIVDDDQDPETDVMTIGQNMVSITPVHFDLTNYQQLETLQKKISVLENVCKEN